MRLIILVLGIFLSLSALSQAPALIPYQAVARDGSGQPMANVNLNARFTIHDGAADGAAVWQELQTVSTTALGLFTARLGGSIPLIAVDWANGVKFMQVEIDLGNGFIDIGTQQMLSVPYALHSESSKSVDFRISDYGDTLSFGDGRFMILDGLSGRNPYGGDEGLPHTCGIPNIHNPHKTYGTLIDQEGNEYKTIVIGNQEWMAENLKTSIYSNGDAIQYIENPFTSQIDSIARWTDYNEGLGMPSNLLDCPCGKLYNKFVVLEERNVCPVGWHLPTYTEWAVLFSFDYTMLYSTYNSFSPPGVPGITNGLGMSLLMNCPVYSPSGIFYWNAEGAGFNDGISTEAFSYSHIRCIRD